MKNGQLVGTVKTSEVTHDDVLGMIILGKMPEHLLHLAGPGATNAPGLTSSAT
jgi:D-xylose transport system ATP-binding protein